MFLVGMFRDATQKLIVLGFQDYFLILNLKKTSIEITINW